jgi:PEGA domain.
MTERNRNWLFRIFVFLFVVITIYLSLYATGYRVNLSWPLRFDRMLLKTGTLALDTTPKGATVTITSETKINAGNSLFGSKDKITPLKIKNLLPGEYVVSFTLDNYWPYQKKLRVNPEQTTFLEDVILFRKSLPLNVYQTTVQNINYSTNGHYAWLSSDKKIIDLETEQEINTKTKSDINWSENGKQIIDGAKVINLENNSVADYSSITGTVKKAELSGDLLIYQTNNNLSTLNTKTKISVEIPSEGEVLAYKTTGDTLYFVTTLHNQTMIKSFDLKNNKLISSATLLNSKNFSFSTNKSSLLLTDGDHKIAYLIKNDGSEQIIKDVIRGVTVFKWLDDNKLAYASESEIYIYDLAQTKPYLITRLSEKINSLAWSTDNYLIYSTAKAIGTINLTSEGNDITVLWQGENLSSLYLNNKTGVLYFSASIGQQSGLYKMALK